ncbi:hypothetical protein GF382_02780 [Candidatus Falkowbacteria bacterium]|nr:hypothetical protein [Candidatus Falkowbacteria bacterium]
MRDKIKLQMNFEDIKKLNIPKNPGCYKFFDDQGKLLYIGKAANLRSRVFSYWRRSAGHSPAKHSMMKQIDKLEVIETGSEIEALLLESNLIKRYQPPYNVVMRDDKRYQYIKITEDEYPRVVTTREIGKTGRYFGPFTSGTAVRETMKAIRKIFPCGGFITMPKNRTNELKAKRYPELYNAPENKKKYKKIIKQIETFLEGNARKILKDFELKITKIKLQIANCKDQNKKAELEEKRSALKYRVLNMKNVLEHANVLSIHDKYAADVVELAKVLSLPKTPQRIEGYDISNIFGQEAVGSMVVFKNGEPDKNEYRKFKIKEQIAKNKLKTARGGDTAMLKEVLERRFNNNWSLPDLIIIDGGKGQLNAGLAILKKKNLDIPIISISKGEGLRSAKAPDKIFFPGEKEALKLPLASPALHIIKRVRDEAHRFAITYHRSKRSRSQLQKK